MKKVLFLYTELAEYVLACIQELEKESLEVHVVRWPINKEAPFEFRSLERTHFYDRSDFTDESLIEFTKKLQPDVVFSSGWVDKGYLKALRAVKKQSKTVVLLDNQWLGTPRQRAAMILARSWIKKTFDAAWVPGEPQRQFALRLGFKAEDIQNGFYCADTGFFSKFYHDHPERQEKLPKRFIFVGRYLDFKGIFELWNAFIELKKEYADWELICAGTGDLWDQRIEADGIEHLGFVQPSDFPPVLEKAGVFVLPSHKEPWGVVIHEMAAAGFPLICSKAVGAASWFVKEGENGFTFNGADQQDLFEAMKKIASMDDETLTAMGKRSHEISSSLTPTIWKERLLTFIDD
ncbi:glycosyltransferase family 4 protein [Sanyastnella coralliicola]|uniref:glycosyltransferase family 4 protein n=1 Tax=Sanyastnella coralliicola TaxID=3069118 RepID=UPI0027BA5E69|nr:glycosyltransferase [Longitalea sp. SCSIO 12813]